MATDAVRSNTVNKDNDCDIEIVEDDTNTKSAVENAMNVMRQAVALSDTYSAECDLPIITVVYYYVTCLYMRMGLIDLALQKKNRKSNFRINMKLATKYSEKALALLSHEMAPTGKYDNVNISARNGLLRHYLRLCVLAFTADKLFHRSAPSQSSSKTETDCEGSNLALKSLVEFPVVASYYTNTESSELAMPELAKDKLGKVLHQVPLDVLCQYAQLVNTILVDKLPNATNRLNTDRSLSHNTKFRQSSGPSLNFQNVYEKFTSLLRKLESLTTHVEAKERDTNRTDHNDFELQGEAPRDVVNTSPEPGYGKTASQSRVQNSIHEENNNEKNTVEGFNHTKSAVLIEFLDAFMHIRQVVTSAVRN